MKRRRSGWFNSLFFYKYWILIGAGFVFLAILGWGLGIFSPSSTSSSDVDQDPAIQQTANTQVTLSETSPQEEGIDLSLPDVAAGKSLAFLSGVWKSGPLQQNQAQDDHVVLTYQLDDQGHGEVTITTSSQVSCKTKVQAHFLEDMRLSIRDVDFAKCSDGSVFDLLTIVCQKNKDNQTNCEAHYRNRRLGSIRLKRQQD